MNLFGELYLDDDGEAHFICHTPGDMSFSEAHNGLQKFIDLLESKFEKQKECPHYEPE